MGKAVMITGLDFGGTTGVAQYGDDGWYFYSFEFGDWAYFDKVIGRGMAGRFAVEDFVGYNNINALKGNKMVTPQLLGAFKYYLYQQGVMAFDQRHPEAVTYRMAVSAKKRFTNEKINMLRLTIWPRNDHERDALRHALCEMEDIQHPWLLAKYAEVGL
jgi:hypothetical protein